VITPVLAFIVAIPVFDELHVPPVCVEENVVVNPTHTFWVPDKVPATGAAVTVTVLVILNVRLQVPLLTFVRFKVVFEVAAETVTFIVPPTPIVAVPEAAPV